MATPSKREKLVLVDEKSNERVYPIRHVFTHFLQMLIVAAAALAVGGMTTLISFRAAYNSELSRINAGYRPVRPAASGLAARGGDAASELLLARVQYAALRFRQADSAFAVPGGNRVAFLAMDRNERNNHAGVGIYDSGKDPKYASTGNVDLYGDGFAYLADRLVPNGQTMYALGLDGSKFVAWETGNDNSPGPCFSAWLEKDGLWAADLDAAEPKFEKYAVSPAKAAEAQARSESCQREIDASR